MDPNTDYPLSEEENLPLHSPATDMKQLDFVPVPNIEEEGHGYMPSSIYSGSDVENQPANEYGQLSLKRPAEGNLVHRAFKRKKGILNMDYLDLLNADIEDAAHRVTVTKEADVESSQFGVSFWSSSEKKLFFEAAARLGQDDLLGIAAFIGTKSEVEVNHYLSILRRAQLLRQREGLRPAIEFPEYPAAVELSQPLCHALDEAADAISVRQEHKEELREEGKWGELWDISPKILQKLEKAEEAAESQALPSARLFHLRHWLSLSERIFMNSSIPSDNWHFIDSCPPSMWATTFEDFHSLAISITRRLVQTTIFLSMSRIRSKRELTHTTQNIIKRQDVEAAVASLGLTPNSRQFWLRCARRLRLEVYEEPPSRDEEADQDPLTYSKVEQALRSDEDEITDEDAGLPSTEHEEDEPRLRDRLDEEDFKDEEIKDEIPDESESDASLSESDEEEAAITQDANEVLHFSAADFPKTHRTKQSLHNRVAAERRQELLAEECDQHASWQAEAELWELLEKKPPMELPKVREPGALPKSKLDTESMFPIERDWRTKTRYHGEWEVEEGLESPKER
ncbi:hypothetical protein B0T10DRAFT_216408 [Thelonectria olida]|uniref:RNA polymerase I-specific transcription initiation factor rrn5 n=1 Tax=Thelonectria olida TaxID=1576542 RepID=A0A9P8WBC7_9HYPO|nr:hypothetical protein B0T10DRAFT_216408 [Thelonectria olida]